MKGWLIAGGIVAAIALGGALQGHAYLPTGMSEGSAPIVVHRAAAPPAPALWPHPAPSSTASSSGPSHHLHLVHAYLGWRVLPWLFHPRLLCRGGCAAEPGGSAGIAQPPVPPAPPAAGSRRRAIGWVLK
jgi:hypothetical protein